MKINEHDCVVLTADLPGEGPETGDVGTVIHIHKSGAAYEVEFTTLDGRTLTVATVESKKVRPVSRRDVAHVRELQRAAMTITIHKRIFFALISLVAVTTMFGGTWTQLANPAPDSVALMLLLSDGTVMVADKPAGGYGNAWYRLTPDIHGSYVNGTWTTVASMHDTRLWYSSQMLIDGRVFVAGGENGTGYAAAEVYDPLANTWEQISPPTSLLNPTNISPVNSSLYEGFSDSISEILPSGQVMVSPVAPSSYGGTLLYDPIANSWSNGPTLYLVKNQDEASWVKLPDNSILTINPPSTNSERYIPSLNQWINDASLPFSIFISNGSSKEMGAAFLLPNGNAFFLGASGNTAIYTPSGNTNMGTWMQGPNIPTDTNGLQLATADAPAAMMVNGHILCAVSPITTTAKATNTPTYFFSYEYEVGSIGQFVQVNSPTGGLTDNIPSFQALMLDLPDGTVLYSHFGTDLYSYTPDGSIAAGKPTISSIIQNADGSYHLTGTLLNGISAGAAYGDDAQMNGNHPLVRVTNSIGNVYYERTYNWSSTSVMSGGTPVTTEFTNSAALPPETYSLVVVANGFSSDPFNFLIQPKLSIVHSATNVILTWTTNAVGFTLQFATNLFSPSGWSTNLPPPVVVSGQNAVTNAISSSVKFYRLGQ